MNGCDCGRYVDGRRVACAKHSGEGWRVVTSPTGMVTRGDPRPATVSPFVARALAGTLPAKVIR